MRFRSSTKILSDKNRQIMNDYDVSLEVKKLTVTRYKTEGINLDVFNGANGEYLPVPATYVINQKG